MTSRIKSIFIFYVLAVLPFSTSFAQPLKAIAVSGGEQSSLVVAENNEVFSAGAVLGRSGDSYVFDRVFDGEMNTTTGFLENISGVGAGWVHALALTKTGQALAWGDDSYGELGNGTGGASNYPVWVHAGEQNPSSPDSNLSNIICIAAGRSGRHSLVVESGSGICFAWGINNMGQCSDTNSYYIRPKKVLGGQMNTTYLQNIIAVSAGEEHSMALASDGSVYTFGSNDNEFDGTYGRLGINNTSDQYKTTPQKVHGVNNVGFLADINSISAGWSHCMALQKYVEGSPTYKGRVYCWGNNGAGWSGYGCGGGRLGDGTTTSSAVPVQVLDGEQNTSSGYLENIVAIAAGESHSMMLDFNGFVYCVGDNTYGQLGNGTNDPCATPVKVLGFNGIGYLSNIVAISAGYWHNLAIDSSGQAWVWGDWHSGKLGIGATSNQNTPYPVSLSDPNVWNKTQNYYRTTIQDAIDDADSNDVLMAYPAIYNENVDFGSKQLILQSSNPAAPSIVAQTIINGSGDTVTFTDNNSTLDGFTIAGGGHGVYCYSGGSPTISNCIIRNTTIAGVYCTTSASPTIENCIIKDNSHDAIFCSGAGQAKILNNMIVNNNSGGILVQSTNTEVAIRNNTISRNN